MFSEWSGLVSTLRSLERRIEILQIHKDMEEQNKSVLAVSTNSVGDLPNRHYYRDDFDQNTGVQCKNGDVKA